MRKNYKLVTTFIVLLSMITIRLGAQLSGAYTINSGQVTAGTNYQTFGAFATAINAGGVNGPVSVNVIANSGPYNEQVTFNQITGTTATNSITINGNGNTITFAGTSGAPHTFLLNGTDFMFVNNLTLVGTSIAGAMVVHLYNGADDNVFTDCTMNCPANGTGNKQCPVSIGGSANIVQSAGNGGDNNIFQGCTLFSGYWGVCFYTNSGSPANTNNQVLDCNIRDFYFYGMYNYYAAATVARGNTLERPTRTVLTTTYAFYAGFQTSGGVGMKMEQNKIRNMFGGNPGQSATFYGFYNSYSAIQGGEVIVRNNVISDIHNSSTCYGYYNSSSQFDIVEHNTFVFDSQISTAGTLYGIMSYNSYGNGKYRNNLVSIVRSGSGQKTGFYFPYAGNTSNYNVLYVNSPSGTNYYAYDGVYHTTFASYQNGPGGNDANSVSADPMFNNPSLYDYTPTNPAINNVGFPLGVATDITGFARNLPAPDAGAYEFFNQPCTGTPSGNSILTPSYAVCGSAMSAVTLANSYTVNGLTYAWGTSTTSAFGPFTAIPGGTLASIVTSPLPVSTWYTATITCSGFGSPLIVSAGQVTVSTTILNTIPYYEDFEGVQGNNELPNCSWLKSGNNAQTYTAPQNQNRISRSGSKFASFYYTPAGSHYFYTNGLQLYAGVTYSASLWFTTEYYGYQTYSLSILIGTSQSSTGLVPIVANNSASSPNYKQLSDTFSVANSGIYYIAVHGKSNALCCGYYLSWDDLSVTVPCEFNEPTVSVNASPASVCQGQALTLSALGNNNTYSWSTGASTSTISDMPNYSTDYVVVATNTITNCTATVVKSINVRPAALVFVNTPNPNVCAGSGINLIATGTALTYTWNTGAPGSILSVTPAITSGIANYSVSGTNAFNCVGTAVQAVNVYALPSVIAASSPVVSCEGSNVSFTGSGANTYEWVANNAYAQGASVLLAPTVSTTYTLTGTDGNGCSTKVTIVQQVVNCTSIKSNNAELTGLSVFPNPTTGEFSIELLNGLDKTVTVSDVTGRIVSTATSSEDLINMNIQTLANGIYYVTVRSNSGVAVMKMVKQ